MTTAKTRVLMAKPGLDGHDRGAKVVARALRDAGMEVVYTGLHQTPEMVVNAAIQEDVDVLGISIMSGAHGHLVPRICQLLKDAEADDISVLLGGIIPEDDFPLMKEAGVMDILTPGSSLARIVETFQNAATAARQKKGLE